MPSLRSLVTVLLAISVAESTLFLGRCPRPPPVYGFNPLLYGGQWYEYARYFASSAIGHRCNRVDIFPAGGAGYIGTSYRGARVPDWRGADGTGVTATVSRSGNFQFLGDYGFRVGDGQDLVVIDADSQQYLVVWRCSPYKTLYNEQQLFVLTRRQFPDSEVIKGVLNRLTDLGIDVVKLTRTDHRSCPARPVVPYYQDALTVTLS